MTPKKKSKYVGIYKINGMNISCQKNKDKTMNIKCVTNNDGHVIEVNRRFLKTCLIKYVV
jgi:hypothetical protein